MKATRSQTITTHPWLDLDMSVFDFAGQFLDEIFTQEKTEIKAFNKTSIIIYLLDYSRFNDPEFKKKMLEDIPKIKELLKTKEYEGELVVFLHKIDLIKDEEVLQNLIEELKASIDVKIIPTSIHPHQIYTMYNAIYELLGSFSAKTQLLKNMLDEKLKDKSKTMFFITNYNNNIVAQANTPDFDFSLVNHMYELVAMINDTFDKMGAKEEIEHFIMQTTKDTSIILKLLNLSQFKLKNIVCFSSTISSNKLIWICGEISRGISLELKYTAKKGKK